MRFIESSLTYRDALILVHGFLLRGLPYRFLTTLGDIALTPDDFVFGSLPFMKRAFAKQNVQPPAPFDYFDLQDFLHRTVWPGEFGDIAWTNCPVFCKPRLEYKTFPGKLTTGPGAPGLPRLLPDHYPVWFSSPVCFRSEVRYYILGDEIVGDGRYDEDGAEEAPLPDLSVVQRAVDRMRPQGLAAYALDFGVLDTGETALVEVSDAWSTGYYHGSLRPDMYSLWLEARYRQILCLP